MWIRRNRRGKFPTYEKPAGTRLASDLPLPLCCWSCGDKPSKFSLCAHKIMMQMHRSRHAELALLGQGPNRTVRWNPNGCSLESPFELIRLYRPASYQQVRCM